MMSGIYAIRCKYNNRYYIGQTSGTFNSRFNCHKSDLRKGKGIQKLQIDWDLYGEDNFEFLPLEEIEDKLLRNEAEKVYIQKYNAITIGYNTSKGGIGQGNFGYLNGMYGKQHSLKSKELMSLHRKGLTSGDKNPNYGNHDNSKFTLDVRRRMSESQKKRWARIRGERVEI